MSLDELDWDYFQWLLARVHADKYGALCDEMHHVTFNSSVPNDDNRASEGRDLRREYLAMKELPEPEFYQWLEPDASIFEMLVALSNRAGFLATMPDHEWFMIFLRNLGFHHFEDSVYCNEFAREVSRALRKFNSRRYRVNGQGGLFPVRQTRQDQRQVEIYYQLCQYLQENEYY